MRPATRRRVVRAAARTLVFALATGCERMRANVVTSAAAAEALLNTDRQFSQLGATSDLITSITAMFAVDVVMPLPGGTFARSLYESRTALSKNPANATSRAQWYPVRGAISADGEHGFTAGYMTITADTGVLYAKYIAYWAKEGGLWRVAAYKRAPLSTRGDTATLGTLIPAAIITASGESRRGAHLASLIATEKQFSDTAQRIGLQRAFTLFGAEYAINMGPSSGGFIVGASAIGASVGGGDTTGTSPVHWSADFALVASSGDLGVTFGLIQPHARAGQPPRPASAFFTIWSRPGAQGPWKYVAE